MEKARSTDALFIGSEKVSLILVSLGTAKAESEGDEPISVGGVASGAGPSVVKAKVSFPARELPARSLPSTETVYCWSCPKGDEGLNTARRDSGIQEARLKETGGTEESRKVLTVISSENSSSTVESSGTRVAPLGGDVLTIVGGV